MPRTWGSLGIVCALLLAAAVLRLPQLDRRPMHADEAILADKFGTLLATGTYPYDPREYHGPVLAYVAWVPAHLTGRTTYATLSETTLRVAPAVTGILVALSPLLLTPQIGATAAIVAAALLAVSPAMVYYSRDFIPEMPFNLWTALLLAALLRRDAARWSLAGLAAALMLATKETAVLSLASAAVACLVAFRPRRLNYRPAATFCVTLAGGISVLIAPPWKWRLFGQAALAYLQRGVAGGLHDHPWYSHFQWLLGWHYSITEAPLVLSAAAGLVLAWRSRNPPWRFLSVYALLLFIFYSAIPYKTPWCATGLVYALALPAGMAATSLLRRWPAAGGILLTVLILSAAFQAWVASLPYASDQRNPWVYAQTGPGVFTVRDSIETYAQSAPERHGVPIDVYTRENFWPLPWYLRGFTNVRWWTQVATDGRAAPIVLVSPALEPDLVRKIYEAPPPGERELYMNLFPTPVELRPHVEIRGYVAKSLWDRQQRDR
jgi:predicted membrane-bound mannosyltransferase